MGISLCVHYSVEADEAVECHQYGHTFDSHSDNFSPRVSICNEGGKRQICVL